MKNLSRGVIFASFLFFAGGIWGLSYIVKEVINFYDYTPIVMEIVDGVVPSPPTFVELLKGHLFELSLVLVYSVLALVIGELLLRKKRGMHIWGMLYVIALWGVYGFILLVGQFFVGWELVLLSMAMFVMMFFVERDLKK